MADTTRDEIRELSKAVVALHDALTDAKAKTASELHEIKERFAKDINDIRKKATAATAQLAGEELADEFPQHAATHPLDRILTAERPVQRVFKGHGSALDDCVVMFQEAADRAAFLATLLESRDRTPVRSLRALEAFAPKTVAELRYYAERLAPLYRANDAMDLGTELANWLPTMWSTQLIERLTSEYLVAGLFNEVQMPAPQYVLPISLTDLTASYVAEQIKDPSTEAADVIPISKASAGKVQFTAKKFAVRCVVSDEATEDTITPLIPQVMNAHVLAHAEAIDTAILDGQASGTIDTGESISSTDRRKAWDGLRYIALQVKTGAKLDISSFSYSALMNLRGKMGDRFGKRPQDLAFITSFKGFMKFLQLNEVVTLDKYGPNATVLTGELAKLAGIPVIVTGNPVWERLNANGVADGQPSSTYTCVVLVNTRAFMRGVRTGYNFRVLQEVYAPYGAIGVVSFVRADFRDLYPSATDLDVVYGCKL